MNQHIIFLHKKIAELTEIVESTAKDAARYQWATAPNTGFSTGMWQWLEGDNGRWLDKETADQLIDHAMAAPHGNRKPLFKDMIDQHPGLAEELAAVDAMIDAASTAEIHSMLERVDAALQSTHHRLVAAASEIERITPEARERISYLERLNSELTSAHNRGVIREARADERIAALEADKEVMAQVLRRLERTVDRLWVSHHANEADYALEQISAALALHEKARDAH